MRRSGKGFRAVSRGRGSLSLPVTDRVMNSTFWIGVYPGMTRAMLAYVSGVFGGFINGK